MDLSLRRSGNVCWRCNRGEEAKPYFAKAYEVLSQDVWLVEKPHWKVEAANAFARIFAKVEKFVLMREIRGKFFVLHIRPIIFSS